MIRKGIQNDVISMTFPDIFFFKLAVAPIAPSLFLFLIPLSNRAAKHSSFYSYMEIIRIVLSKFNKHNSELLALLDFVGVRWGFLSDFPFNIVGFIFLVRTPDVFK